MGHIIFFPRKCQNLNLDIQNGCQWPFVIVFFVFFFHNSTSTNYGTLRVMGNRGGLWTGIIEIAEILILYSVALSQYPKWCPSAPRVLVVGKTVECPDSLLLFSLMWP